MSLRVLFVTRKWPPAVGGMETYAARLCAALGSLTQLDIRALPGRADGSPPGLLRLASFLIGSALALIRHRADVIHLGDLVLWPLAWLARLFGSAPTIVMTAYGLDLIYGRRRGVLPAVYRRYLALGVRLTGHSVRIIAISGPTAQLCREAGFNDVVVVTLGVDVPPLSALPIPSSDPFVLFVGRLVKRKGAGWFARHVVPRLPPGYRFVAVGKCWDKAELDALKESPNVEYRDVVSDEDLLVLRRQARLVVMPNIPLGGTDMEGFGLTALEAAAAGGVLLASGIEGIVDAVVDGSTGFLLPSEDAGAWAAKIAEVACWSPDDRAAFVTRARETVVSRYSWQAVAQRTLDAYQTASA